MNQKIAFMFLVYYTIISLVFVMGNIEGLFTSTKGYSSNNPLNSSEIQSNEIEKGGFFSTGVSFGRFIAFVTIGVGLPDDTPSFFLTIFSAWQIIILIMAIVFFISAIWNG